MIRKCVRCGQDIDIDVSFETTDGYICLRCKAQDLNRKYKSDDQDICPRCGLPGKLQLYKGMKVCESCTREVDKELLRPGFVATGRLPVGVGGNAIYLPSMSEGQIQQKIIDSLIDVAHQEGIAGWSLRVAGISLNGSDQFLACLLTILIDEMKILVRLEELGLREARKLRHAIIEAAPGSGQPSPVG
jgi:DNA-directed RNA polymerase subunit RPC12/RpoP